MYGKITSDKFRYWLISIDLLEKEENIRTVFREQHASEQELFTYYPNSNPHGFRSLYRFDDKLKKNDFSEIYIDINQFLGNKLILTFGKLNTKSVSMLFSNVEAGKKWKHFKELQKKLLLSFVYPNYLKKKNRSILNEKIYQYPLIRSPLILYLEPIKDNLFFDSLNNISHLQIRNLIKKLDSYGSLWSIINGYILMTFLNTQFPWRGLIFLNANKLAKDDNKIHLPEFIYDLMKHIACYHWLDYRKRQLLNSGLSKFDSKKISIAKDFKEISKSHEQVLTSLGQFFDNNIKLLDEIPYIKEFNNSFLKYFKILNILEPDAKWFRGLSTIERLESKVSGSLESIENINKKLTLKAQMLSNFSRDILDTKISKINLKLQRLLIVLTIILAILTGIFAIQSFL